MAFQAKSYRQPDQPPHVSTPEGTRIVEWVWGVLDAYIHRLNNPSEVRFQVMYSAPTKVRVGMVVYADGTLWNPGAGEGLYVWKMDSLWHKIV